ncbi:short-chain dehydrogenase [Thelonectria olida]|uniref:Short-chain dehydrogenase n=1 Tax=Thelonectria olida TaxID=1576542 RepID=A0A9P9AUH2_9HYPO|nr:short-chain dehydrogenase [Thelonectria olida]
MSSPNPLANPAWEAITQERAKGGNAYYFTSDQVADQLHDRIKSKTVIITGVTIGSLGADAARVIAAHSPELLILAGRSLDAINKTIDAIKPVSSPHTKIEPLVIDLGDQSSVRAGAALILNMTPVVDVLVNSAALMMIPEYTKSVGGIEMHLAVNHIGHFLLTNLIMSALLASEGSGRVVNVSAAAHRLASFRFDDYNFNNGKEYEPIMGYAQSKCANLLFTQFLATRLGPKGLLSYGVDPGGSLTNLFYRIPTKDLVKQGWALENGEPSPALKENLKTVQQATASYITAAFSPDITDSNGCTVTAGVIDGSVAEHATDPEQAEKLWKLSEELVGQIFNHEAE